MRVALQRRAQPGGPDWRGGMAMSKAWRYRCDRTCGRVCMQPARVLSSPQDGARAAARLVLRFLTALAAQRAGWGDQLISGGVGNGSDVQFNVLRLSSPGDAPCIFQCRKWGQWIATIDPAVQG